MNPSGPLNSEVRSSQLWDRGYRAKLQGFRGFLLADLLKWEVWLSTSRCNFAAGGFALPPTEPSGCSLLCHSSAKKPQNILRCYSLDEHSILQFLSLRLATRRAVKYPMLDPLLEDPPASQEGSHCNLIARSSSEQKRDRQSYNHSSKSLSK